MSDDPLLRGTPPGSLRQFAVMYASSSSQRLLQALYAFEAEINDTVTSSGHEVAHTRLQYWRGEVDRLIAGRAQHPVTQALLPLREAAAPQDLLLLHEVLVAADIALARLTLATESELEAYCFRASGSLQTLAAIACAVPRPVTSDERLFARRLGSAVKRTEFLRDLRQHILAGRLPLPLDELCSAQVDLAQVQSGNVTPEFAETVSRQRDALVAELNNLPAVLEREHRVAQRHGLVLATLYAKLAGRIVHRGELARSPAELSPWNKVWTAWRTAVRHR